MSDYVYYQNILNKTVFSETYGDIEIKTRTELLESKQIDQECVKEIFQTGMKAATKDKRVYYFPIICRLKVAAVLLLFPKNNAEKEFLSSLPFLEKLADLSCKWIGKCIEHEQVKREYERTKVEIKRLYSVVAEPLCLVSKDGMIQEINDHLAAMVQIPRSSLIGEKISRLMPDDSWRTIQKLTHKNEIAVKIHFHQEDFLALVQPISYKREIHSYLVVIESKKELKKEHMKRQLYTFDDIKGTSKELKMAVNAARRVAQGDATIMLRGESGTGKEMFAQSIHMESNRKDQPFIAINCAAIPENLLESELFGYEKGAFTGADRSRPGRFELANKGTLFLDEIGDMPLYLQAKILRVIQEKTIERIGSNKSMDIDVRLITATHQNLEKLVREGKFREDLYYRISVIPIHIPPLRERKEDLPILIEYYMREFSKSMDRPPKRLSEKVIHRLLEYHWPGNIRELQNVIRHFVELEIGDTVTLKSLPASLSQFDSNSRLFEKPKSVRFASRHDKNEIIRLLDQYGWGTEGKKKAAADLGISLATLYRKLKKLKLS